MKKCSRCREVKSFEEFYKYHASTSRMKLQPYCKPCSKAASTAWEKRNRSARKQEWFERDIKKKYGLTMDQYDALLKKQGGCCAICRSESPRTKKTARFAVDHDHATEEVRGLLCWPCNGGLGSLGDDMGRLFAAIQYLARTTAITAAS